MRIAIIGCAAAVAVGLAACGSTATTATQTPVASVTPAQTVTEVVKTVTQAAPAKTVTRTTPPPTTSTTVTSAPAAGADGSAGGNTVPTDLVNKSLDEVENELDGDGIGYQTVSGGAFGIVLKADWGVCDTKPGGGQPVNGPVQLIVGHFTCGA